MHADARFIERYLEKDHKLKHLPKEIKDHYFKGQNFDLEKLFKDTLFIIEQNFKYNDRYVLIDSSADSFDMREVNDKEAIFSKKELLMIKNSPRWRHLYNGKWEKKEVNLGYLEIEENDFTN